MVRWAPNAAGRLAEAAMTLYAEQGFDATTVAQIAERAGLTERTFFRHFADKREVLFSGAADLRRILVTSVADAPDGLAPLDVVARAFEAVAGMFTGRLDSVLARQAIIDANPDLQERELIKMAGLATALTDALRAREIGGPAAELAAEAGVAVFRIAFARWTGGHGDGDLRAALTESFADLRAVTAGRS